MYFFNNNDVFTIFCYFVAHLVVDILIKSVPFCVQVQISDERSYLVYYFPVLPVSIYT